MASTRLLRLRRSGSVLEINHVADLVEGKLIRESAGKVTWGAIDGAPRAWCGRQKVGLTLILALDNFPLLICQELKAIL
jgi:hypothetical protein